MDEKHNCLGKIWEIFESFPKKIAENALFWTEILKPRVDFLRVCTKKQIVGKFWENFQKIS